MTDPLPPATPGWVKAFGIIFLVLVLAVVIVHVSGGGFRRHTLPVSFAEHGLYLP